MLYRNLSGYFREKYHGKIKKICIDGGFSCPNRDGTCGVGGCVFCGERGAGEHISAPERSISEQVEDYFAQSPKGDGFIAYFQNFTNTYAPVEVLRARYNAALTDDRIVALAVGTRPDCISEEVADLLESYTQERDVWVELGLQTASNETAARINRGYPSEVFTHAVKILRSRNLPVVVHLMLGLPGETQKDLENTVSFINQHDLWGIKIHSVYVMKGTVLEQWFRSGIYQPPSMEEYAESAAWVLSHISPEMIIHRITGDCPPGLLVAPEWNRDKNSVISEINRRMEAHCWKQGCLWQEG